jgi:DNA topoisomerase-3
MGKILIIAEKPSVMTDLSRSLAKPMGKFEKHGSARDAYFENEHAVITSAVGHLVELKMPMGPNGKKLPWNFTVLPAIPEMFELEAKPESEARLNQVLKLAKRKDIDLIVNACDAGREGELIFEYIMQYGGIRKPVKRLWMQSMTQQAIVQAWNHLRDGEEMTPLADAAKCRSESDWLVGLNATRALTCFNSRHGGFNITAAGRVQTPTLAILANREEQIRSFEPTPYFEVHATFGIATGDYLGKWIDPDWKKDEANKHSKAERLWDLHSAETIRNRCEGNSGDISEETTARSQIAPQLYDLTTLQKEAPFSAKGTLSILQKLYEQHKVVTYPRTDSRYLPEDYLQTVRETLGAIAESDLPQAGFAKAALDGRTEGGPRVVPSRRVFNDKEIRDHFAIIPTGTIAKLNEAEQKLFDIIVRRFIAVFYPAAEFEDTTRLTRIEHGQITDTFHTKGSVLIKAGWLEVYGRKPGVASGKDELAAAAPGESAEVRHIEVVHEQTKPPARFTESTLLSAMQNAGKLIDDEELAEAMSERGLGTPATRAAIIEGLILQKYIVRDGRDLHVTPSGMRLIELLRQMGIEGLYSPKLTGDWEHKLLRMEQGKLGRDAFMREITSYTADIVTKARGLAEEIKNQSYPDLAVPCPACGAESLRQTDATYECRQPGCTFKVKKHIAGRLLAEDEARELFTKGHTTQILTGFKSKFNKPFDAALRMDEKFKVHFVFENDDGGDAVELTEDQVIGEIDFADGRKAKVYQTEKAYHIPAIVTKKEPAGIRIGRSILKLEIPPDQVLKLVASGRSDLLKGFVSNRTKRKFDAHLTFDASDGKVGFEFPPRQPGKKSAKVSKEPTA